VFDQLSSEWPHGLFQVREEGKPIDVTILIKRLLENLQLIFLEENAVCIQGLS
jgi:hypothetical protein